ncbi:CAP domain-containing protein [Flavimaricola marinus]|uniref:Cysteine-rich secretory protein family protein n=1 Tax=Flavimaricola marinus TaxID=1819565 RepID=A0A238LGH1_9RHOB|nr:CAP domain-containing protein [Flavimaricola marinus]SMY08741.1 Cysteine-rich secretory protein family protein [Flavimaricola marinus]
MRLALALMLLLWPVAVAAQCAAPGNAASLAQGIYAGVNAQRGVASLGALSPDRRLAQAAQAHACDVARAAVMSHRGTDGSNSHERVERTGFPTCLTAENLAWGYSDPAQVIAGWMRSDGHRRNIQLDRATSMGLGIAQGPQGPIWVLVFARSC